MSRRLAALTFCAGLLASTGSPQAGPLHKAVGTGDIEAVTALLDEGAVIDELDGSGKAPLHIAAEKNNVQIIERLVSRGADPDQIAEGFYGPSDTPVHIAIKRRNLDAIRALADAGASLTLATVNSPAPLHLALKSGRKKAAALLISLGATSYTATRITNLIADADVAKGEEFAGICRSCHALEKNTDPNQDGLEGPPLWNIAGSAKAASKQYEYSQALVSRGGTWTYEELNNMIANPTAFLPGTKMDGTGTAIKDHRRRAAIIAYLRLLSDAPVPLPK